MGVYLDTVRMKTFVKGYGWLYKLGKHDPAQLVNNC